MSSVKKTAIAATSNGLTVVDNLFTMLGSVTDTANNIATVQRRASVEYNIKDQQKRTRRLARRMSKEAVKNKQLDEELAKEGIDGPAIRAEAAVLLGC